jgi:short-subunit dehydrogenase
MAEETALITGASSGIGLEFARLFAADRSDLVLAARRQDVLERLAEDLRRDHGVRVRVVVKDLADAAAPIAIAEELAAAGVHVDVLVNNAGFGAVGQSLALPVQRQLDMVQVNVTALTHLCRLLLPPMLERRSGGILNVASTAAFQPGPYMAVYYATKAYVLSFTEALAEELRGTGISVTCLAPGPTETEFVGKANLASSLLFKLGAMSAQQVAKAGYRGFRAGKVLVIPGLKNKLGAAIVRLVPRWVVREVVKRLNQPVR